MQLQYIHPLKLFYLVLSKIMTLSQSQFDIEMFSQQHLNLSLVIVMPVIAPSDV